MPCPKRVWEDICVSLVKDRKHEKLCTDEDKHTMYTPFVCANARCGCTIKNGSDVYFAMGKSYCSQQCRVIGMSSPELLVKLEARIASMQR